ncbi:radical SAM protein [Anaerolinea sp.]|uniref:radical SAM protein n=1 Tax=Anaerolinea sp. TaxID=1872519 RepID=UPI002ACDDB6E|nr:radical SAM protein [Anaerolinea sp.]
MGWNSFSQFAQEQSLSALLTLLEHASDADVERLLSLAEHVAGDNSTARQQIPVIRRLWQEKHPGALLIRRVLKECNPRVKRTLIRNVVFNNSYGPAAQVRARLMETEGFRPPFTMLISPSMRCNLHCVGCYAANYTRKDDLPAETFGRLLREGKELGIYLVTVLGGEPFVYPELLDLCEAHPDVAFMVFTNGTLLNEKTVERIARLGNIAPMISVEGFREETDARRGIGTFERLSRAMQNLHQAGVFFGFSSMVTRHNVETVCGDAFNDWLVEQGAFIGWHFMYMPVGDHPNPNLMPTPAQREWMRVNGAARIRNTRPLFVIDFWNDAPYVGGCIAGAKEYFHINSRGDVEPCIFTHFATHNIHQVSLREALDTPFFRAIRERQPFNPNLLLPCQLIDNPHVFRQIAAQYHPYPTHPGAESLINELAPVLDEYAACVQQVLTPAWQEEFVAKGFCPPQAQPKPATA